MTPSFTDATISGGSAAPFTEYGKNLAYRSATRNSAFLPRVPNGSGGYDQMFLLAHTPASVNQSHIWLWNMGAGTQSVIDIGSSNTSNEVHICPYGDDGQPWIAVVSVASGTGNYSVRLMQVTSSGLSTVGTYTPISSPATSQMYALGFTSDETDTFHFWVQERSEDFLDYKIALPGGGSTQVATGHVSDISWFADNPDTPAVTFPAQSSWLLNGGGSARASGIDTGYEGGIFTQGSGTGSRAYAASNDDDAYFDGSEGDAQWLNSVSGGALTSGGAIPANTYSQSWGINYDGDVISLGTFNEDTGLTKAAVLKLFDMAAIGGSTFTSALGGYGLPSPDNSLSNIPHFCALYRGEMSP